MRKMLIALDDSPAALAAAEYAGKLFAETEELEITLLHVLPFPPAPMWDEGHIPDTGEKEKREAAIHEWLAGQRSRIEPVFSRAAFLLQQNGIPAERIRIKTISDSIDVPGTILEEARDSGCEVLVLGRKGESAAKRLVAGSVTSKVINHGTGTAILVVE